jgi:hypothetical protein
MSPFVTASASASAAATASVAVLADPAPLELVESGFTAFPDDQGGFASYAALIHNPNSAWAAARMEIHVDFYDAADAFLAGEDVVATVLPGQTTAIGGEAHGAGDAARMEVVLPDDLAAFQPRDLTSERFEAEVVQTSRAGGQTTTIGQLTSLFATEQTFVQLVAVYRNGEGSIIGGAGGGVESIAPGASAAFEVVSALYPELSGTEVYWQVTR